jgi:hypothetical protein
MNRKLLDGTQVPALDVPVVLTVLTKCPWKYKLVDMETGQVYIGQMPLEGGLSWVRQDEQ